jgi:phage anti-repressor protein
MANHAPGAPDALIPVFTGEIAGITVQLCNARDLHEFLQVGTKFADWISRRIEEYGFVEGEDFITTLLKTGKRSNVTQRDYHLTLDMAKELAMVENNARGREIRRYFIQCERQALEAARSLPPLSNSAGSDDPQAVLAAITQILPRVLSGELHGLAFVVLGREPGAFSTGVAGSCLNQPALTLGALEVLKRDVLAEARSSSEWRGRLQ